ncbi:DUF418 domain-containing protein [Carboxylicivirga caseinilyticus]|uniref:DUF418 domain-containing protein n=1 Tax=Carboxylicivirga caseinilyticus TaxID=3417572 RepID=UPI003D340FA0|nr:DUF418 domain-containing protein [Marinilabiliaceae bacterium A049]
MNNNLTNPTSKPRIVVVDALRGLALTGILLLHALEHFDFYWAAQYNPDVLKGLDKIVHDVAFFLFAGKSYAIFSVLFGFSFFIQMQGQERRGIDFRGRFVWRLLILLVLGYLHTLIYMGDILMIYALMGLPLIFFYKVPTKFLIAVAAILLLHVNRIYELVYSFINPDFVIQRDWGDWGRAFQTFCSGSFWDVLKHNSGAALITKVKWTVASARVYQLFGLFVIGMILGRIGFFEKSADNKRPLWIVLSTGIAGLIIFQLISHFMPSLFDFNNTQRSLIVELADIFTNLSLLTIWISGFMLLYYRFHSAGIFTALSQYGRMSLTSYVMQPLIGVPLFYGYGLALYQYLGNTLSFVYAALFWVMQIWFCQTWFKHYKYGPLEWFWRALTFFNFKLTNKKVN